MSTMTVVGRRTCAGDRNLTAMGLKGTAVGKGRVVPKQIATTNLTGTAMGLKGTGTGKGGVPKQRGGCHDGGTDGRVRAVISRGNKGATREESWSLESVPAVLLGRIWPAERVVMGLRVCKTFYRELLENVPQVVLVRKAQVTAHEDDLTEDLRRMSRCIVTLKWEGAGGAALTRAVVQSGVCGVLHHLELTRSNLGLRDQTDSLARMLTKCTSLVHLNVGRNSIGAKGFQKIAKPMQHCKLLAHIDLSNNPIGFVGANALARVLADSALPDLNHLVLGGTSVGMCGASSLATALKNCKALVHLDLRSSYIGGYGMKRLATALRSCEMLTSLDVRDNAVEFSWIEDVEEFANEVAQLKALVQLDLRHCVLGTEGAETLTAALLAHGNMISHLDLRLNGIDKDSAAEIRRQLGPGVVVDQLKGTDVNRSRSRA